MVQQDHQTQPISNDHLSLGNSSHEIQISTYFVKDSHPRRWGGVVFFPKQMAEHICGVEFK